MKRTWNSSPATVRSAASRRLKVLVGAVIVGAACGVAAPANAVDPESLARFLLEQRHLHSAAGPEGSVQLCKWWYDTVDYLNKYGQFEEVESVLLQISNENTDPDYDPAGNLWDELFDVNNNVGVCGRYGLGDDKGAPPTDTGKPGGDPFGGDDVNGDDCVNPDDIYDDPAGEPDPYDEWQQEADSEKEAANEDPYEQWQQEADAEKDAANEDPYEQWQREADSEKEAANEDPYEQWQREADSEKEAANEDPYEQWQQEVDAETEHDTCEAFDTPEVVVDPTEVTADAEDPDAVDDTKPQDEDDDEDEDESDDDEGGGGWSGSQQGPVGGGSQFPGTDSMGGTLGGDCNHPDPAKVDDGTSDLTSTGKDC